MGYAKDPHEEVPELETWWEQGKTRFSINFVREAERILPSMPNDAQKTRLIQAMRMIKQGELSFVEPESVTDFLGDFREKQHHEAHG